MSGAHFGEYQRLAGQALDICGDVTPAVERISIHKAFPTGWSSSTRAPSARSSIRCRSA